MKTRFIGTILSALAIGAWSEAQMPVSSGGGAPAPQPSGGGSALPSSFDASGSAAKPQQNDPTRQGETPPPQLLGMEMPLMDPSTDTVSYNGGVFDVGNNAAVRARFEKYLQQLPDDSAESKRYRKLINDILKETQRGGRDSRYVIGSETLIRVGKSLYKANEFPGDGGQSGVLASAMVSALDVQRANLSRSGQNAKLDADINELVHKMDRENAKNAWAARNFEKHKIKYTNEMKDSRTMLETSKANVAEKKAEKAANKVASEANLLAAKVNYQSILVSIFLQRRFDHVVIGSRVYRHLFKDGDVKLNVDEDSQVGKAFSKGTGMPPTVNALDSAASNARREIDQSIEAVHNALACNRLGEATQQLIAAVAIGEYMQSVATFPAEARRRIAQYWTLRKRAYTALNARDYATVEEVAAKMKEMDVDFDNSLLLTYTTGKKRQSDLAIRNAMKALQAGDEEKFNTYIAEAGMIWPRNPNLDKGAEMLNKIDAGDPVKEEFRNLYKIGEFRRIAAERERFKVVNMDPELAKQYEEVITLVMKIDGLLGQLKGLAQQDVTLGPCMAYEKLIEWQKEDERYARDKEMMIALKDYESQAHDFVQALRDAKRSEERGEYGSALSCYYRAQCKYPGSGIAKEGIRRVSDVIVKATYP